MGIAEGSAFLKIIVWEIRIFGNPLGSKVCGKGDSLAKDLIMKIRHNSVESLTDEQKLDHKKEEIASLKPFALAYTKKQTDR